MAAHATEINHYMTSEIDSYKPTRVKVGWGLDLEHSSVVFQSPKSLLKYREKSLSNRAIQACPAVNELERDFFVIECPFDIRLRCSNDENSYNLHMVEMGTRLDEDLIKEYLVLMDPKTWRKKDTPVIQLKIPYFFIADEPCYLSQLPPFMSKNSFSWPGTLVSGRFPTDLWPRVLNWAFEWTDLENDLILKRGEHLCYLNFETSHAISKIDLVPIEKTPELIKYRNEISATPKFVSNTFSLFQTALERRPKKLLKELVK